MALHALTIRQAQVRYDLDALRSTTRMDAGHMKCIELNGPIDEQHRLRALAWAQGLNREWFDELAMLDKMSAHWKTDKR